MKNCEIMSALVVDDSDYARKSMSFKLKKLGINVREAGTFEEAMELVSGEVFDLLVCDTNLDSSETKCEGVLVAQSFRKNNPKSLIVGVSAVAENESVWSLVSDHFIIKGKEDFKSIIGSRKVA